MKVYVVLDLDEMEPEAIFSSKESAQKLADALDPDGQYVVVKEYEVKK
jgi:hypothetical protein